MQFLGAFRNPRRFFFGRFRMVPHRGAMNVTLRLEPFGNALFVLLDERIRHAQHFRRAAIILGHKNSLATLMCIGEIEQVPNISATPCINRLIRVAHDEQIAVVFNKLFHERDLQRVDILKLVDHDVLKTLLPLQRDIGEMVENMQRDNDEVVVIESKAFFLLIQITVENDVVHLARIKVFLLELRQRKRDKVEIIIGALYRFQNLDHIARLAEGFLAQGDFALIVNHLQHRIDIGIVEHQKALRIPHGMRIFLQHRNAEAMERANVARIVIARHTTNALPHFVGRLIAKRDAQNIARQNAQVVDQVREPMRERARFARASTRNHANEALSRGNGFELRSVQLKLLRRRKPRSFLYAREICLLVFHAEQYSKSEQVFLYKS